MESTEEIRKRVYELTDKSNEHYPRMEYSVAIHELIHHLLGDDWYVVDPLNNEQVVACAVFEIEKRYKNKRHKSKLRRILDIVFEK